MDLHLPKRWICSLVVLALCAAPLASHADMVAVLEFTGDGSFDDQQRGYLADKVRGMALRQLESSGWEVVTRENMLVLIQSNADDLASCVGECEVETGRLIGARLVVAGSLVSFGSNMIVTLRAYETDSGKLRAHEEANGATPDELIESLTGASERLFEPWMSVPSTRRTLRDDAFLDGGGEDWDLDTATRHVVRFSTEPAGAAVTVDGDYLCDTPCSKALTAGPHAVSLVLGKYELLERSIVVSDSTDVAESLIPQFALLTVLTNPSGLNVKIDGDAVGQTPVWEYECSPGSHEVKISDVTWIADGMRVTVNRGEHKRVTLPTRPRQGGLEVVARDRDGNDLELSVRLDGESVGRTPWTDKLQVGRHEVEVGTYSEEIQIWEREITRVEAVQAKKQPSLTTAVSGQGVPEVRESDYLREEAGNEILDRDLDDILVNEAPAVYIAAAERLHRAFGRDAEAIDPSLNTVLLLSLREASPELIESYVLDQYLPELGLSSDNWDAALKVEAARRRKRVTSSAGMEAQDSRNRNSPRQMSEAVWNKRRSRATVAAGIGGSFAVLGGVMVAMYLQQNLSESAQTENELSRNHSGITMGIVALAGGSGTAIAALVDLAILKTNGHAALHIPGRNPITLRLALSPTCGIELQGRF